MLSFGSMFVVSVVRLYTLCLSHLVSLAFPLFLRDFCARLCVLLSCLFCAIAFPFKP